MLEFKYVDANGTAHWEQMARGVSIELSLVTFTANRKREERHQNKVARITVNRITAMPVAPAPKFSSSSMPTLAKSTGGSRAVVGTVSLAGSTLQSPNFDSYMADLYRRMQHTWMPPHRQDFRRVVVQFKINKDGTLSMSDLRIEKSSGNVIADKTALQAVQNAAPFKKLPDDFPNPYETSIAFDNDSQ